ncbi:GNAT family N-acetyltransferase [Altericista sp. CCNU0014]|uniref:GNAT family N-acetyltransferase n=1 Tax=Altericista sp. CCNU0014 TaxID=3082949 RepID=UPI00384C5773
MEIRNEKPEDLEAVRRVNVAAFGRASEAILVDRLRGTDATFSFVALHTEQIVGHVFLSPVAIDGNCPGDRLVLGLAPVAVLPEYQRQGIGSLLIRHSLKECDRFGVKAIVVLGSPEYYSRFGFAPAKEKGLKCEYSVPEEAFMVLELESDALEGCNGTVKYRLEFDDLE